LDNHQPADRAALRAQWGAECRPLRWPCRDPLMFRRFSRSRTWFLVRDRGSDFTRS
jgi:hypothetical protein